MENISSVVQKLENIFIDNSQKRICVVGSSCVGKSTLIQGLPEAVDMDDLLFGNEQKGISAFLSQKEIDYVCGPWSPEIGQFMTQRARELIKIKEGHPVFGTIVFPCDLIIEIVVPDNVLRERVKQRNIDEKDVFNMKAQIESEIEKSGIEKIVIENA